ncbi:MAG: MbnP family protein [Chitinophagaceae bacterium]|nr:MbnP family protein [Chitinophagaceae bacterium]
MKTLARLFIIAVLLSSLFSCRKESSNEDVSYSLKVSFKIKANGEPLSLNKKYFNALGEDFNVNQFKFYTSNFSLQKGTSVAKEKESYHLVDASNTATQSFIIKLANNKFSSISFWVGVDSARNVSGAQAGDLDPAKGMFWTWNTGYIMAKLEGTSSFSTATDNFFEYHIGGFKANEKTQRFINLSFPGGKELALEKNKVKELVIEADLDKWFSGVHQLPISAQATWMTPGGLALKYADNYATMFTATAIIEQ